MTGGENAQNLIYNLRSIKLGHKLDVLNHSFVVYWNSFEKLLIFVIAHSQFKSAFYGSAELLLSQQTLILSVYVAK